ncbi:ATP-binding protein [Halobellus sp. EA9]|uniref:ATP-binding protein n=1 Tax=Halobellus sp. EA9 TaxID=3421647 RepID=UPI003EBBF040
MRIKRAFVLSVLLVAVVLAGAVFVGFQEYKGTLYAQEQTEVERSAEFVGSSLDQQLAALERTVAVAADNPDLARHGTAAQRRALARFRNRSNFSGASVIAANGTMTNIVSDVSPETRRELIGSDFGDRTYFRRALAGETYISDPVEADSGNYIITVSTPITRDGRVVGTLNAAFHLSEHAFFSSFASTLDDGQQLTMYAQRGEVIYASNPIETVGFAHNVTVSQTGWTVSVRENRADVESTIRTVTVLQAASVVAVLAVLFGFGLWIYRSNIQQVERLLAGFEALEAGRYGSEISLDDAEEWQQIERSFNRVSRAIEQSRDESRARERALRRERDRFEALFEGVPVPIVNVELTDDGTYLRDVNAAFEETFGYDAEAVIGRDINDLIVPDDDEIGAEAARIDERAAEGEQLTREVRRRTEDGVRDFLFRSAPINPEGSVSRQFGVYIDITDRKEYEKRLRKQRDNLDVLNQVVRHDIRNDLQLVTAHADFLAESFPDADAETDETTRQNRQHLEKIRESASHAVELTETARNIADLLLTDADEPRPVDLRAVLSGEIEKLRSATTDAAVSVEGSLPDVSVRGDDLLSSVFGNLLSNAVQHNDEDVAEVVVSATVDDEDAVARVRIADNGPGVPDSRKEAIFGKGEKGLESSGTGLGLYLVQSLVDAYGGAVWVEDNEPEGAVFVVELPLAE